MCSPHPRYTTLLALMLTLVLLCSAALPQATLAQEPPPPAPTDEPAPPLPSEEPALPAVEGDPANPEQSGELYVPPVEAPASDSAATADATAEPELVAPEGYTPPDALADLSLEELADLSFPNVIQGDIKLDLVVSPARVAAGGDLTYTYIFTNTRNTAASNFIIRARWTNFKLVNAGGVFQFCKAANCPPEQAVNATVSRETATDIETVYKITSSLAPGQTGRFAVVLSTRTDQYPRTAQAPKRPAGSAQLADSTTAPVISEDTANSLFVAPVFVLTKLRTSTPTANYANEVVEFTITIGNATAAGDTVGGAPRTDADPATNISLIDKLPGGSEFVSADGPVQPSYDAATKELRWTIPGPLNPGGKIELKLRFKKLDLPVECGKITNNVYSVSSDQMPIQTGTTRFRVSGPAANADIRTPLLVQSITATPSSPLFGTEAALTIRVQSYWNQPINNLEVRYSIQSNAFYVVSSANPAPASAPSGGALGGDVVWRFNMPAGSITTPASQSLTLVVRGSYSAVVTSGTGVVTIVAPAGVPSACLVARGGAASFQPRLYGSKFADPSEVRDSAGRYVVGRADSFTYIIKLENRGVEAANDMIVNDLMPTRNGANFSYVRGSATLNGQAYEPNPDDIQDGDNGTITWRGIDIPAGGTAELRFSLKVEGNEYVDQCNRFSFSLDPEPVRQTSLTQLCVRISPPFTLTKTANRTTIDGNNAADNKEVIFSLSYTNRDSRAYDVALFDVGGSFEFVRMDDSSAAPVEEGVNNYVWPTVSVAAGASYQVRFVARLVPPRCASGTFNNDLVIRFTPGQGGTPYLVATAPTTRVAVVYTCGVTTNLNQLSYNKAIDAAIVSTRDRHLVTLTVKNENTSTAMTNVEVSDVLPSGFSYAGMGVNSKLKDAPVVTTRADGRLRLSWKAASLAANTSTNVQFYARSGDIVGTFTNWMRATGDSFGGVKGCGTDPLVACNGYKWINDEGENRLYATRDVKVEPMASLEPSIDRSTTCAAPTENRTYQIALVNTNRHAYASTTVTATIPLGLHFDGIIGSTPAPKILSQNEKGTVLRWENLYIAAKPGNAGSSQLLLQVRLKLGQVWGALQPRVEASSPDGSLPKKDGILDPTVRLCDPSGPAVGLDVTKSRLLPDEEFFYVISVTNPGAAAVSFGLENTLSPKLRYLSTPTGTAPTVAGQKLSWSGLSVPAASPSGPGLLLIVFKVKLTGAVVGDIIPNRVTLTSGTLNSDNGDVDVRVVDPRTLVYLPIMRR